MKETVVKAASKAVSIAKKNNKKYRHLEHLTTSAASAGAAAINYIIAYCNAKFNCGKRKNYSLQKVVDFAAGFCYNSRAAIWESSRAAKGGRL